MELKKIINVCLPVKLVEERNPATGKPMRQEIKRAEVDMLRESQIIS